MNLIIETGRLGDKPERICGREPAASLEIDPGDLVRSEGPLSYDLTVQRVSDELVVRGALEISFGCRCARCGDDFIKNIFIAHFCRNFALTSKNEIINLTPDVREDILLSLPMIAVCSDTCRGLCGVCGVNLNREKCKCKRQEKKNVWKALDDFRLSFPA